MLDSLVAATHGRSRPGIADTLWFLLVLLLPAGHAARASEASTPHAPPSCSTLARVPGPEDLVLDEERSRLLVSSQDRRPDPWPPGEIWAVPLDPVHKPYRLDLAGRGYACSFHPHGIDLVESCDGRLLLYVLNHHDADDRLPERACFAIGGVRTAPKGRISSVEVFEVEDRRLRFLQRLADPEILTNGNDLVARPNGDVWVTDPPAGRLAQVLDLLGPWGRSRVVQFECSSRRGQRCLGSWKTRTDPRTKGQKIRFANGIAFRPSGEGRACDEPDPGALYVAGGAERKLHRFTVKAAGVLEARAAIGLPDGHEFPNPDNLSWIDAGRTRLLVAGHPNLRRFLQHSRSQAVLSPSAVVEVPARPEYAEGDVASIPVFQDSGGMVSGASVALCVEGDLVLGQVFEPAVVRCVLPEPCDGGEGR